MLLRIVRKWNCSETLRSRRVSKNLHPNEPRNLPSIEREAITRQVVLLVQADRSQPIVFVFELIKSLGCSSINCSRLNDFCCIPHPTAGSSTSVSFAFSVGKLIEWNNSRIGLIFVAQSEEDKWNHSAVKYREKKLSCLKHLLKPQLQPQLLLRWKPRKMKRKKMLLLLQRLVLQQPRRITRIGLFGI